MRLKVLLLRPRDLSPRTSETYRNLIPEAAMEYTALEAIGS
jgi:hypothetical protein